MVVRTFVLALALIAAPALGQREPDAVLAVTGQGEPAPPSTPSVIELKSNDGEIAERLRGLFAEIDGLDQVRANVRSGVVTLSGKTLTDEDRQRAQSIAERLSGVASVENEVSVETDVGRRIEPLVERSREMVDRTIGFLPLLLVAGLVFGAVWLVGFLLTRKTRLFAAIAPNPLVRTLVGQVIRLVFVLIGLILAMRILGATALLGSLLGAAGVFGLAVGFAIRDTIENYIASILLSIRRPFAPNDLVVIEGFEGRVSRLNSRATFLVTLAGNEIRIPNAVVYKAKIENYTSVPERRFEFRVGIGYENKLSDAMAVAHRALLDTEGVLADPEPVILVDTLGDSTITIDVRGWMNQDRSDFYKTRSAAIRSVKEAFDSHCISMPEPIHNLRIIGETEGTATEEPKAEVREQDARAIADTSPDRTIEGKAAALREGPGEDLLTEQAPRE